MNYFVVWLATTGAFGFSGQKNISDACIVAAANKGSVFKLVDPGFRHSVWCSPHIDDCGFPGYVSVPITCVWKEKTAKIEPAHWEECQ